MITIKGDEILKRDYLVGVLLTLSTKYFKNRLFLIKDE